MSTIRDLLDFLSSPYSIIKVSIRGTDISKSTKKR